MNGWCGRVGILATVVFTATATPGEAADGADKASTYEERIPPSAGDFGGIGLLQTRTARFGPDGQFDVGVSQVFPYRRYYLTLTGLPWLEGTFRYSDVRNVFEDTFGVRRTFKDRGADLKLRVLDEGRSRPAIAVGVQDGLGTGQFSAEYIVLSKRYLDFDFSLGMGWGYLAGRRGSLRNPLASISDQFKVRSGASERGGTFTIGNYFSGERVALFGGIEYQTPVTGLSVKLEYDGNDFANEPQGNRLRRSTPINVGVNYRPYSWADLALGYERGDTVMMRASLRYNFNDPSAGIPKFLDPPPPPLVPRKRRSTMAAAANGDIQALSLPERTTARDHETALINLVSHAGSEVVAIEFMRAEARVYVSALQGQIDLRAVESILTDIDDFKRLTIVSLEDGPTLGNVVSYDHEGVTRELAVERLFALAEASGLSLLSVDLARRELRVQAQTAEEPTDGSDDFLVAQTLAQIFRRWADEVTFVRRISTGEELKTVVVAATSATTLDDSSRDTSLVPAKPAASIAQKVLAELNEQDITLHALHLSPTRATAYITPRRYRELARNLGRAARVVANNVPATVEEISFAIVSAGVVMGQITILRVDVENAVAFTGSPEEIWAKAKFGRLAPSPDQEVVTPSRRYPDFSVGFRPRVTQLVGDAAKFVLIGVIAGVDASLDLAPGLGISAVLGYDVFNNFDEIKVDSTSTLPHVRSDLKFYLQQRELFIERLQADYVFSPFDDVYGRMSAGLFEWMYGGVSAEVLYRPFDARWAVGADINRVRQRTFDQLFEFRDYEVTTGHGNFYYDLPFYDLLSSVHVGQFLARDIGASFRLSRLFESGIRVGVWATLTNVSAEEFGEGSFDKGFFVVFPFQLFFPRSAPTTGSFAFRPLTRDGGQMVSVGKRLYDITGAHSLKAFARDWRTFLD